MDIITALSKNMPLIVNLEKRFKKFIVKNLSCSNPLVSIISKIALSNPMSDTGCNYINLLDCNSELNVNSVDSKMEYETNKITQHDYYFI